MKKKTYKLPLIPLRDMVGFPNVIFPFLIGRHKSILALKAIKNNNLIFLSTQKSGSIENPSSKDIEPIGVIARIIKKKSEFDNTTKVLVSGISRGRITRFEKREPYFLVEVEEYKYQGTITKNIFATAKEIVKTFENLIQLSGNNPIEEDILEKIRVENDPIQIAFTIAFQLPIPYKRKQKLLLIQTTKNFLNELFLIINNEYEIAKLQSKIRGNVKKKLDSIQKKIILTQQMESIKKELNELEGWTSEIDELKETVKKSGMPKETMEKAIKEVKKLDYTPNFSPEYTVILNYLNWLTSLPWKNSDEERKELRIAKNILEKDHWGLKKIKERIVEILAVRQLSKLKKGPVICFVGPPGVGKTSLGKSIARAMNRKFVRISLGGIRDEAEIRGHRRTYIGALPGKIIQTMKRAGVTNPVFLMDEIDKLASDFRGDPASALLEVLDPEQNYMFEDHYLDVDYDLSKVFFITTANNVFQIPEPLRDRMEIIFLSGYTTLEKYHIANNYLIPRQVKENGLTKNDVKFFKNGIMEIIEHYTQEAGVRNLERQIGKICRKIATMIVDKKRENLKLPFQIKKENINNFLGIQEYKESIIEKKSNIGVVNGLAWTRYGGVLLSIESALLPGKGNINITGQIGKVMQESAQIGLSLIKANHEKLKIGVDKFKKCDIHIHVPEGAIPKDGPSAGITIATSMISTYLKKKVPWNFAMTGELTLTGRILPIGGLKEKLLAALRIGITNIFIPKENVNTLEEVPEEIKNKLNLIPVETIWQVWEKIFGLKE